MQDRSDSAAGEEDGIWPTTCITDAAKTTTPIAHPWPAHTQETDGSSASARKDMGSTPAPQKPVVLLVESDTQVIDHDRRRKLATSVDFLQYDCESIQEFIERLQPGGPYAHVTAILRTGWLKSGRFATHNVFAEEVVRQFPPSVKLCSTSGHGYDFAAVDAMTERGIWFCNTPGACTEAVANSGLALVLETFRYFTFAQWCARFDWMRSRSLGMQAVDPDGKTLGIVGMGGIGLEIARKCEAAFGMKIRYCGPRRKLSDEAKLAGGAVYHSSLHGMIPQVDCLVIAAPFTAGTHHLLSSKEFSLAKEEGLRVVNIARGKMVDEAALLKALEDGSVVGVGLDVHENEPQVNERLRENWKVTLLPHIGVCSRASWANFERQQLDNLETFLETGKPCSPVNKLDEANDLGN